MDPDRRDLSGRLTERARWAFAAGVFLAALAVRVGAVALLRGLDAPPTAAHGADGLEFEAIARNLATGNGFCIVPGAPTSFRAPGFPLALAAVYAVCGTSHRAAYLFFAALGAAASALAYGVGREVGPERQARAAAVLCALFPPHIYFATSFISENLFAALLPLAVLLLLRHDRRPSSTALLGAGLVVGVAALTRPFALLMVPIAAAWLLRRTDRRLSTRAVAAAAFGLACVAPILPWTLRNRAVHGRPVLIATNGGSTFYGANNSRVLLEPAHWGGWLPTTVLPGRERIEAAPGEVAHDQAEWALGVEWVRSHLPLVPVLGVLKIGRLCLPEISSASRRFVLVQTVFATPFLILLMVGLVGALRGRTGWAEPASLLHGAVLATVVAAVVFWGSPRFRDANAPLLMVYAAAGLALVRGRADGARDVSGGNS